MLGRDHAACLATLPTPPPSSDDALTEAEREQPTDCYLYIDSLAAPEEALETESLRRITLAAHDPNNPGRTPGPTVGHPFILAWAFWDTPSAEERKLLSTAISTGLSPGLCWSE